MPHGFRSDYEAGETAQDWREQLEPAQRSLVEFARLYRGRFERGVLEEDDRLVLIAVLADLLDGKPVEVPQ